MNYHKVKSLASRWFVVESFLAHYSQKWRQMINVKQEEDGSFTISWDENDPQESILNTWTQEDFINAIQNKLQSLEELGVLDNATEAINQINDHIEEEFFIDQTAEEVNQDIQTLKDFIEEDEEDRRPRLFF